MCHWKEESIQGVVSIPGVCYQKGKLGDTEVPLYCVHVVWQETGMCRCGLVGPFCRRRKCTCSFSNRVGQDLTDHGIGVSIIEPHYFNAIKYLKVQRFLNIRAIIHTALHIILAWYNPSFGTLSFAVLSVRRLFMFPQRSFHPFTWWIWCVLQDMTLSTFSFLATSINLHHIVQFCLVHDYFYLILIHEIAQSVDLSFVWTTDVGIGDLSEGSLIYCIYRGSYN